MTSVVRQGGAKSIKPESGAHSGLDFLMPVQRSIFYQNKKPGFHLNY